LYLDLHSVPTRRSSDLREPSVVPSSGFNWFLRKFLGLFTIGVLQALISSGILLIGLKIEVQSVPLFILFSIITSLVFIALIQFLDRKSTRLNSVTFRCR